MTENPRPGRKEVSFNPRALLLGAGTCRALSGGRPPQRSDSWCSSRKRRCLPPFPVTLTLPTHPHFTWRRQTKPPPTSTYLTNLGTTYCVQRKTFIKRFRSITYSNRKTALLGTVITLTLQMKPIKVKWLAQGHREYRVGESRFLLRHSGFRVCVLNPSCSASVGDHHLFVLSVNYSIKHKLPFSFPSVY